MMETFGILYLSAVLALMGIARNYIFKESLRIKQWVIYLIITVVAMGSGIYWVLTDGIVGTALMTYRVYVSVSLFLLSCFTIKEYFFKHALFYLFMAAYYSPIEATAKFVRDMTSDGNFQFYATLTSFGIILLTLGPFVYLMRRAVKRFAEFGSHKVWIYLFLAGFAVFAMNMVLTYSRDNIMNLRIVIGRWLLLFGMMVIFACAWLFIKAVEDSINSKTELELVDAQRALQTSHYERLLSQIDEIRRIRHDMRHHRATLNAIVSKGDIEALRQYIQNLAPLPESVYVSGNMVVDSIIMYYSDIAAEHNIAMENDLIFTNPIPLSEPDLCVLLGNLIENAMEAQKYVSAEKRFVHIKARCDDSGFTLAIDNSFDGVIKSKGEDIVSRKEGSGHGIGLRSVAAICEKYNGIFQTEHTENTFMTGVVIGI